MSRVRQPHPALRACALAVGLAFYAAAAQASTTTTFMQATGSYSLDNAGVVNLTSTFPPDFVDVLRFPSTELSNAGLHSYGSTTGNFGSRSSGGGVYDVTGSFKIVQSVTNTSGTAANAIFNFYITPGLLANYIGSAPLGTGEFVTSGISFDVKRGASSVWGSSATLTSTSTSSGASFSSLGDTSLYTGGGSYYTINGVAKTVDLGVINAGETIELSYELKTFAQGSSVAGIERVIPEQTYVVPAHWIDPCSGGYGGYGGGYGTPCPVFVPEETVTIPARTIYSTPSSSHANAGDPFTIEFEGNPVFGKNGTLPPGFTPGIVFAPVPEPSTWGLMFAGLGLVGFAAKRRKVATA
jgi:PEP-CTERM motif